MVAFALLCAVTAVAFVLVPTYPNYDSYYMLLWGRELLDGAAPRFEGFRVPTQHPLGIAVGALLAPLGDDADRVWIALVLVSLLWLVWGIYRLGAEAFTPLVGALAAVLLVTRPDFPFLAARGYIDVPYMALVVWAAGLEQRRPRRGTAVLLLLAAAGLLRPEAWLLAALYWCRLAWRASWGARARDAALAAVGPAVWVLTDLLVTGDPLFSLTYTSGSAEDLGRQRSLSELPSAVPQFLSSLITLPVAVAAAAGVLVAFAMTPRRTVIPFAVLATGLGTFVAIGVAGLSVIERYLTVTALALLVFAAVALGGWTMLAPSRLRSAWKVACAVLVVAAAVDTYVETRSDVRRYSAELRFRGVAHDALQASLRSDATRRARRCGPVTMPTHKLVPDARWILDAPFEAVLPRNDPRVRPTRGPELYVAGRYALFRHAFTDPGIPTRVQIPPSTHVRATTTPYYAIYVRPDC